LPPHLVVGGGAWFTGPASRVLPSRAIELTSAYLDRNVTAMLAHRPNARASPQQEQDLAAIIHLCGAGPAKARASRSFHVTMGERCGDHYVATYLAQVNAMTLKFLRLTP